MRLPLIAPADLTDAQKPLYADMEKGIGSNFNAFITVAPPGSPQAGALMGPWNPWLHEPRIGGAIWELTKAMTMEATLPDTVRQIAILVTGAHFDAAYEIYAHIAVAEKDAIPDATLATLVSGSLEGGWYRLRCRLRAGEWRRVARALLSPRGGDVRAARRQ
jgi:hypothetical protein